MHSGSRSLRSRNHPILSPRSPQVPGSRSRNGIHTARKHACYLDNCICIHTFTFRYIKQHSTIQDAPARSAVTARASPIPSSPINHYKSQTTPFLQATISATLAGSPNTDKRPNGPQIGPPPARCETLGSTNGVDISTSISNSPNLIYLSHCGGESRLFSRCRRCRILSWTPV